MKTDSDWMNLALEQARNGIGRTAPNPPVGSVIVKNGELLGSGWHHAAGKPHAEREALADAFAKHGPDEVRGATAYVTLEPCSTHGRTPPCTDGLIQAGIRRVVYACVDRNPSHAGRADALLRAAGIEVVSGVEKEASEKILRPFFKVRETGLPWIIWKTAMSLDGRITRPDGEGQWLTGPEARADVQRLRSQVDAIITSGQTVRRDLPALTIRVPELLEGRNQPWRIIVSANPNSLPQEAPLFSDEWKDRTLIRGGEDLTEILKRLVIEQGVLSVMIEAGGKFSAAMIEAGLIDEVAIYYAPMLCGGPSPGLAGSGLNESLKLDEISFVQVGDDLKVSAIIAKK
jgi:diaminohydroxyphosphoribosylaminopyrimidine deaminase/5-amino-6-(5-phosphoribosylamino)uracil reductase